MDAVLLIYNVLLIILYSITLTLSYLYYIQTKKTLYLYSSILFLFYIFDNLVIYMTEFISWFSTFYDNIFMSVPTYKTIIFVVTLFCMIRINSILLGEKSSLAFHIGLIVFALVLLFIPMMPDSALKVWLYYLPCQIFTFVLGIYGYKKLTQNKDNFDPAFFSKYRRLLIWTIVFSVLIVIEDSIVIFNFDVYTDILVKINNRSLTEDIMSIGYSIFAIINTIHFLQASPAEIPSSETDSTTLSGPEIQSALPEEKQNPDDYSKFYLFCKEYQLTSREQDILTLLLENMNNQEISDTLMISVGTAKTHTHNIFQKLNVTKRQQLLDYYNHYEPSDTNK